MSEGLVALTTAADSGSWTGQFSENFWNTKEPLAGTDGLTTSTRVGKSASVAAPPFMSLAGSAATPCHKLKTINWSRRKRLQLQIPKLKLKQRKRTSPTPCKNCFQFSAAKYLKLEIAPVITKVGKGSKPHGTVVAAGKKYPKSTAITTANKAKACGKNYLAHRCARMSAPVYKPKGTKCSSVASKPSLPHPPSTTKVSLPHSSSPKLSTLKSSSTTKLPRGSSSTTKPPFLSYFSFSTPKPSVTKLPLPRGFSSPHSSAHSFPTPKPSTLQSSSVTKLPLPRGFFSLRSSAHSFPTPKPSTLESSSVTKLPLPRGSSLPCSSAHSFPTLKKPFTLESSSVTKLPLPPGSSSTKPLSPCSTSACSVSAAESSQLPSSSAHTVPLNSTLNAVAKILYNGLPAISGALSNASVDRVFRKAAENLFQQYGEHFMQSRLKKPIQAIIRTPYPQIFRQIWPLIPELDDGRFMRNFGLEVVTAQAKPRWTLLKLVCKQCSCDFAPSWQVHENEDGQIVLCEPCKLQDLKDQYSSSLKKQFKELLNSIKAEQVELEEAQGQKLMATVQKAQSLGNSNHTSQKTGPTACRGTALGGSTSHNPDQVAGKILSPTSLGTGSCVPPAAARDSGYHRQLPVAVSMRTGQATSQGTGYGSHVASNGKQAFNAGKNGQVSSQLPVTASMRTGQASCSASQGTGYGTQKSNIASNGRQAGKDDQVLPGSSQLSVTASLRTGQDQGSCRASQGKGYGSQESSNGKQAGKDDQVLPGSSQLSVAASLRRGQASLGTGYGSQESTTVSNGKQAFNAGKNGWVFPGSDNSTYLPNPWYRGPGPTFCTTSLSTKTRFPEQPSRAILDLEKVTMVVDSFRPMWPIIPKNDRYFMRNFGMEAVMHRFKRSRPKKPHPKELACSKCNFDFASSWHVRKAWPRPMFVCEACEFSCVRTHYCSKIKEQLKELLKSARAKGVKFQYNCEEVKQIDETAEKETVVLDLTDESTPASSFFQVLANTKTSSLNQEQVGVLSSDARTTGEASNGATVSSILELRGVQPKLELGTKRLVPAETEDEGVIPPSKVCRLEPELSLGITLARSCKQPITHKQQFEKEEVVVVDASVESDGEFCPTSPARTGEESASKRKGTPKRLSNTSMQN